MRERRSENRAAAARVVGAAGPIGRRIWSKAARRPVDTFAIVAACAASVIIIVNAVFLQSGSHSAPFFMNPTRTAVPAESREKLAEMATPKAAQLTTPTHPIITSSVSQPIAMRRKDPIAELIGPSSRIMAVQRVLTEYGYGQIKPSGILDRPTSAAIEKFEHEHKLPLTGRVSDRLVDDLAEMVSHPVE